MPSSSDLARAARRLTLADHLCTTDNFDGDECVTIVGVVGAGVRYAPFAAGRGADREAARAAALAQLTRPLALLPIVDLTARGCAAARAAARREPSYARPEAPAVEAHDCPGCDDIAEGRDDLCVDCRARYAACDAVEYPELNAIDAAWFDVVTGALADLRRARRAA